MNVPSIIPRFPTADAVGISRYSPLYIRLTDTTLSSVWIAIAEATLTPTWVFYVGYGGALQGASLETVANDFGGYDLALTLPAPGDEDARMQIGRAHV